MGAIRAGRAASAEARRRAQAGEPGIAPLELAEGPGSALVCVPRGEAEAAGWGTDGAHAAARLAERVGCSVAVYDGAAADECVERLVDHVESHGTRLLVQLDGADARRGAPGDGACAECDVAPGEEAFFERLLRYSLDHYLGRLPDAAGGEAPCRCVRDPASVAGRVRDAADIACAQLLVRLRLPDEPSRRACAEGAVRALAYGVAVLEHVDWSASGIEVFHARRSVKLIPHNVVRSCCADERHARIEDGSTICVQGTGDSCEVAYHHAVWGETLRGYEQERERLRLSAPSDDCLYLTNRLIDSLFADFEEGLPVVVLSYRSASGEAGLGAFPIGVPKAEAIGGITLSEPLWRRLSGEADRYDHFVFDPLSGVRLFLDLEGARYGGVPGREKVMIPRYYRELLGMGEPGERPLDRVAKEAYRLSLRQMDDDERRLWERCYRRSGRYHYRIRDDLPRQDRDQLAASQRRLRGGTVQIQRVPRAQGSAPGDGRLPRRLSRAASSVARRVLRLYVGYSDQDLRSAPADIADDRHGVVRVSGDVLKLLGVSENDKVDVAYRGRVASARVLAGEVDDMTVTVPAPLRMRLGMTTPFDVVRVRRNVAHTFRQKSFAQSVTVIGNAVAAFSLTDVGWARAALLLLSVPLSLYWVFLEERVKVQ